MEKPITIQQKVYCFKLLVLSDESKSQICFFTILYGVLLKIIQEGSSTVSVVWHFFGNLP